MRFVRVIVCVLCVFSAGAAWAGPVVREASGPTVASIQAAVDQFRADLGPNNGVVAGSQAGGRREINWDGGGAAAVPTIDGNPLARFAARGATFVTDGVGFETSGAPLVEFDDINPTYRARFAPFSPPRLFIARNTNVMDVLFNVPGNAAVPAGVTGFGAVFTDVDSATSTRLQFFAPDGALLVERAVPAAQGDETQSFLGVSFDQGEIVRRVRIMSGNAAFGPDETDALDLVARTTSSTASPSRPRASSSLRSRGPCFRTAPSTSSLASRPRRRRSRAAGPPSTGWMSPRGSRRA